MTTNSNTDLADLTEPLIHHALIGDWLEYVCLLYTGKLLCF